MTENFVIYHRWPKLIFFRGKVACRAEILGASSSVPAL